MPSSPSPLPVKPASEGSAPKPHEAGLSRSHQQESPRDFKDLLDADSSPSSNQKTQPSHPSKPSESSHAASPSAKKTEEEPATAEETSEEPKTKTPVADPRFLFLGTTPAEMPALQAEASLDPAALAPEGEATPEGEPTATPANSPIPSQTQAQPQTQTQAQTTAPLPPMNPQQTAGTPQQNGKENPSPAGQPAQNTPVVPTQNAPAQGVATGSQQGSQPPTQDAPAENGQNGQNGVPFATEQTGQAETPEKGVSPGVAKILARAEGKPLPADLQTPQQPAPQIGAVAPETISEENAAATLPTKENLASGKPSEQTSNPALNPAAAHSKTETKAETKTATIEVSLPPQASATAKEAVAEAGTPLSAKTKEVAPSSTLPTPQTGGEKQGGENPSQQRQENSGSGSFASASPEIPTTGTQQTPPPNAAGKTEMFSVPTTAMGTVASGPVRPAQQNADLYADILPLMNRFLDAAETLPSTQRGRIDLNVPLNDESVKIRLEIRNGEVRTSIRTDSEALRAALETSWPEFVSKSETRGIVLGEAKFDSGQQGQNLSDQGQPSRYREQGQQEGGTPARVPRGASGGQVGGTASVGGQQTTQEPPARSGVKLWA